MYIWDNNALYSIQRLILFCICGIYSLYLLFSYLLFQILDLYLRALRYCISHLTSHCHLLWTTASLWAQAFSPSNHKTQCLILFWFFSFVPASYSGISVIGFSVPFPSSLLSLPLLFHALGGVVACCDIVGLCVLYYLFPYSLPFCSCVPWFIFPLLFLLLGVAWGFFTCVHLLLFISHSYICCILFSPSGWLFCSSVHY